MSMCCTYKFFGFSISYTLLNLPLSILCLPIMLLIPCTFYTILPLPTDNPPCEHISISVILFLLYLFALISKICKNSYDSTPGKQTIQLKNKQMTWIDISKENIEMSHRHVKKGWNSLAIREMQIKTTMSYHLTLAQMVIINKSVNGDFWKMVVR